MKYIKGNLLTELEEGRIQAAGHCCNCMKNMGSGIALAFKQKWPQVFQADLDYTDLPANRLGKITYTDIGAEKYVYNLYGQVYYGGGRNLNYEGIYSALINMRDDCERKRITNVGFAYKTGCDRAGGDWRIVSNMIEVIFEDEDIAVTIVELA